MWCYLSSGISLETLFTAATYDGILKGHQVASSELWWTQKTRHKEQPQIPQTLFSMMVLEEQWLSSSFWRGEPLQLLSLTCFILNGNFQETHTMEADCLPAPREGRALAEPGREVGGRAELLHACPFCWSTRKKHGNRGGNLLSFSAVGWSE